MTKAGKNQGDLQGLNRALVLRLIHRLRVCSRAELARQSGLTKASITGITQQLIDLGVVRETGLMENQAGRRSIGLSLCQEKYLSIGLRLTRRHIRAGLFDLGGEIYETAECRLPPDPEAKAALLQMKEIIARLLESAGEKTVLGVGIASPGPILYREGKIAYMSAFPGWGNLSIQEEMEKEFHLPVVLEHDGVCCALWEWWNRPPGKEYQMMICVLAGQGVGAGILMDGHPIRGALGCAGELGHMSIDPQGLLCDCGNRGCLEKYVSVLSLEKEMERALKNHPDHPFFGQTPDAKAILSLVHQGDPLALSLFEKQAEALGQGIVNLCNVLNPDWIVITDELAACEERMYACVNRVMQERLSPRIYQNTHLVVKPGGRFQAMQAASSLMLDRLLSEPDFLTSLK